MKCVICQINNAFEPNAFLHPKCITCMDLIINSTRYGRQEEHFWWTAAEYTQL